MAGHSKWANIKHRKGAADAKRARVFTKLIKEVTVAAKMGGGLIDGNPRLRLAVEKARAQSVPKDRIENAIKKGTGELGGDSIEEVTYEGYGPAGVAILVDCATDNKTRTVAEVRNVFSKKGGNMGESGAVAWMFDKKGVLRIDAKTTTEDALMEKALECGADDVRADGDDFLVLTSFADFHTVLSALTAQGVAIRESGIEMLPKTLTSVTDQEHATKLFAIIENLEDLDDVQNVWANFDITDELMEKVAG